MSRYKPDLLPQQQQQEPQMHQLDKYPSAGPSTDDDHQEDESRGGRGRRAADHQNHQHPDDEEDLLDEDLGSLIEWKKVFSWKTWLKVRYIRESRSRKKEGGRGKEEGRV